MPDSVGKRQRRDAKAKKAVAREEQRRFLLPVDARKLVEGAATSNVLPVSAATPEAAGAASRQCAL
jgi:hypothetical protein